MVVDINGFIGKWPYWPVSTGSPDSVVSSLARWGIDRSAVCSTRSLFVNWKDGNCEVQAAARQYPDRLVPFACLGTFELSHLAATRRHDLKPYLQQGFRGVRLYPQHHSYHLLFEPFVDDICEQAQTLNLPVLLSLRAIMNWGVPALDLQDLVGIIERHPDVPWIISGVNYLHEIRSSIFLMQRSASIHIETSCVMGYHAIEKLVNECGHENVLFGSGSPIQHGRANLEKVLHADIHDVARDAILSGNAARLLRLGTK